MSELISLSEINITGVVSRLAGTCNGSFESKLHSLDFRWLTVAHFPVNSSHVEGHSTVFGTGLNYTALRLLGVDKNHPVCGRARGTLHKLGQCDYYLRPINL